MAEPTLLERWVRASFVLTTVGHGPLAGHLTYQAQACGRLDVKLRELDRKYGSWRFLEQPTVDVGLADYMDLSRLWVMDAYELVRTLSECMRRGMWIPPAPIAQELEPLKRALEEVRIPLAKYKRARASGQPGDLFPEPRMAALDGAAWEIGGAERKVVGRQSLAEMLLTALEAGLP